MKLIDTKTLKVGDAIWLSGGFHPNGQTKPKIAATVTNMFDHGYTCTAFPFIIPYTVPCWID
jgi:hypothetical protein